MSESSSNIKSWFSLGISILAICISFTIPYYNFLKPFELKCQVDQEVGLHWDKFEFNSTSNTWVGNLGLYIKYDIQNRSPQSGIITKMATVMFREENPEDKYLLEFKKFRVLDSTKIAYIDSEEELPLLLKPYDRTSKMAKFVYKGDEQFPITQGTYIVELLLWLENDQKADVEKRLRVQFTKDVVDIYASLRNQESTTLQWIPVVGHTKLVSRKLSEQEYIILKK